MECNTIHRIHFSSINSTNQWAKDHSENFKEQTLTIITADSQTAGRGRFHRPWITTHGENLCATFAFIAPQNFTHFANLSQIMAIAACKTLDAFGFKANLKWPNDILINKKKVGGILTETSIVSQKTVIIIGIGLNINMRKEDLEKIDQPATSLYSETTKKFSIDSILNSLIKLFIPKFYILKNEGFYPLLKEYNEKLIHKIGDILVVKNGKVSSTGSFVSVDKNGALSLKQENNKVVKYFSGDLC